MSSSPENVLDKPLATPPVKDFFPDWAPWAVLFGLMIFGMAGAFGLVRLPIGARSATNDMSNVAAGVAATATVKPTAAEAQPQWAPPPPDNGVRPADVPEAVEVRQILVQYVKAWKQAPQVTRSRQEAEKRCGEALKKLEQGVAWDKVMEEYSDNPDTKKNGGSLGLIHWDKASWLVKDAIFKLKKVGDRSPVTESPFGYHVYERIK